MAEPLANKIMHGMEIGAAGMHNQIRQWALQPFMTNLIELLLTQERGRNNFPKQAHRFGSDLFDLESQKLKEQQAISKFL